MFKGYLEFSQIDLVNRDRVAAYVANLAPNLAFKPESSLGTLHIANGEPEYRSPILDGAPWANANDPHTDAFYGLYPLDIVGIGDSTYSASSTESTQDGGSTQGGRNSTRDVKLSGILVGADELGAEAGLTWLRAALQSADCADQCGGGYLRYFLAEPQVCEVAWGQENGSTGSVAFGTVTGPSDILDTKWPKSQVDPSMPSRTVWSGAIQEGTEVVFGARGFDGTILASEDVIPLRRNYVTNPTFFQDTSTWVASPAAGYGQAGYGTDPYGGSSGSGTSVFWTYSGGTDGGAYAHLTAPPSTSPVAPSLYGAGTYGAAKYGGQSITSLTSPTWATPAGTVTVSVALRSSSTSTTLQLIDASTGAVVASSTVQPSPMWARYSVTGVTNTTKLSILTTSAVDVDDVLAEVGSRALDFFDGDDPVDGYVTTWLGAPNASVSERRYPKALQTTWEDSAYLPFIQVLAGSISNLRLTWFYRASLDIETQLLPYERTLHNVSVIQGAQVIQRIDNTETGGGYFIQVEVLFNAGNPFSYSPAQLISTTPLSSLSYTDPLPVSPLDDDWLFDPGALVPSAPPSAPDIVADAIDATITSWQRYYVGIPAETVADWASSVPIMQIDSLASAIRQVRVRFHPNPFGYAPQQVDPLSYCADFLISYLPPRTSLLMNGMVQRASATKAGVATVPAESILYGSDGGPMTWPHLSCGIGYVMTIDVPSPADYAAFDLSLQLAREE